MNELRPGGQTPNQKFLDDKKSEFVRNSEFGDALLRYLRKDEVQVVRVERGLQGRWQLFAVLPEQMRAMFDIDREVLFVVTDYKRLEPRALSEVQFFLKDRARVDDEVAVLVSQDENADRLARQRAGETAILTLDSRKLSDPTRPTFRQALAHMLATVDHFNVTTPIREPSAFFGRQRDIGEAIQTLEHGQHAAIFGLRKAGKSSFLNRVQALLRERGWAVVALDLNEFFGTPRRFKLSVVQSFADEVLAFKQPLPKLRSTEERRGVDVINESWLDDLDRIRRALEDKAEMALIIDEIDSALPARTLNVLDPAEDSLGLLRALSQFRAFAQRHQMQGRKYPVLLGAGVDPSLFEEPKVRGIANPLYQFALVKFLEPLNRDEMQGMIRTLGKRTGMRFRDHDLIDSLHAEYGGHPLLSRQACSFLHQHRPKDRVPYNVSLEDLTRAFTATGPNTPLAHALDVPESFSEWFPDEGKLVSERLRGASGSAAGPELQHAIAYGLLNPDGSVRMRALLRSHQSA